MPKLVSLRTLLTAAIPTLFLSSAARADMLPPGGFTEDLATTLADQPGLGGTLEAMQDVPFSLTDDQGKVFYVGQVEHDVVRDPSTSTLSFYYKFVNAPSSSVLGIEDVIANGYTGYATDVAILTDTTGDTAPIDALRSNDGSTVTFDFDAVASRIAPRDTSLVFLVKTNATSFDNKGTTLFQAFTADGIDEGSPFIAGGGGTIASFRPTGNPIPIAPPPPVTVSVPLPPAVWAALPTMIGSFLAMHRLRKRSLI